MDRLQHYLGIAAVGLVFVAAVGGAVPMWKSAKLSPDSIQRRWYWSFTALCGVLAFLSQLPDWRVGLFVGIGVPLGLAGIAGRWTNLVKIRGRVWTASRSSRTVDRPPALKNRV